jgi:hypothetical protein
VRVLHVVGGCYILGGMLSKGTNNSLKGQQIVVDLRKWVTWCWKQSFQRCDGVNVESGPCGRSISC